MRDTEGTSLSDLRHRLPVMERVELDASIERMVEALIKSARFAFGPSQALIFSGNIRMQGKAFMGETGIRISLESEGTLFSNPVDPTAPLRQRPPTPDRLGGHYIVGERSK